MAIPKQPGCTFDYIWGLVDKNKSMLSGAGISPELVLGIFWEETLFNNVFQTPPGTGVGYGQTEPAEFYRFNANNLKNGNKEIAARAQKALDHGYAVFGLPPVMHLPNRRPFSSAPLTDMQSVQIALAMIRDLRESGMSAGGILNAYAGVGFQGEQAAHLARPGGRQGIIKGWRNCEGQLKAAIPAKNRKGILQALKEAREFKQDEAFAKILFAN
jgi:hypothetical protein